MKIINTKTLKKRGFDIYSHNPLIASLKIEEGTYLCLIRKNKNWLLGHSDNGKVIYLQPEEPQGYKTIETVEEIESEIQWLKMQGIRNAIDYDLSFIHSKGFNINDFLIRATDPTSGG